MKIENKTDYPGKVLQAVIRRVAAEELDAEQRKRARVVVELTSRGVSNDGALGRYYGGCFVRIWLPRNDSKADIEKLAHVAAHEFAHARGMGHNKMRGNPRYDWVPDHISRPKKGPDGKPIPTGRTWSDGTPIKDDYVMETIEQTGWRDIVKQMGYCDGLPPLKRIRPAKAPRPGLVDKLAHAKAKVEEWERKKRRAETGLKSWGRKVKYYEREVAAKAAQKGGGE